jgi:hypothetical protein
MDGKVTADEMKAQFAAFKQEPFTKRDANSNGVLERARSRGCSKECSRSSTPTRAAR